MAHYGAIGGASQLLLTGLLGLFIIIVLWFAPLHIAAFNVELALHHSAVVRFVGVAHAAHFAAANKAGHE